MSGTPQFDFDGATYSRPRDQVRLGKQLSAVLAFLKQNPGRYFKPYEICCGTGLSPLQWASASARIRDLRKDKFRAVLREVLGEYEIDSRPVGGGTWEYALLEGRR